MLRILTICVIAVLAACGSSKNGSGDDGDGGNGKPDACVGLECQVVNCAAMGQAPTTLTGTVFAPNGTLPLYGFIVYVPLNDPPPFVDGLTCDQCSSNLPGGAVAQTVSGDDGKFRLENVPVGDNIPLIVTSGKWRRKIVIPHVDQCVDSPLAAADTRLPKTKAEGDIPRIAISTGDADALECLLRKLGLEGEMTPSGMPGRIHMYFGDQGANKSALGNFQPGTNLWATFNSLSAYDIVLLSCEGAQNNGNKRQASLDAMKQYADMGGRVFASHWHNIWVEGNTQASGRPAQEKTTWANIIQFNDSNTTFNTPPDNIDEVANPKGSSFANWMLAVGGSPAGMRGIIPIGVNSGKQTAVSITAGAAERWVFWKPGNTEFPQNIQFTTPNENPDVAARCGKVVFSDMHVSGDSASAAGTAFPGSCSASPDLTPQEKALAFMFFDIASCVGQIF